jgi:hypothetical protein
MIEERGNGDTDVRHCKIPSKVLSETYPRFSQLLESILNFAPTFQIAPLNH